MTSLPHKPTRPGDLDDEFIDYVIKLYNENKLRYDNYQEVARHLNEYIHRKHDDPEFVDSIRKLYKSVSSININLNNSDSEEDKN